MARGIEEVSSNILDLIQWYFVMTSWPLKSFKWKLDKTIPLSLLSKNSSCFRKDSLLPSPMDHEAITVMTKSTASIAASRRR